MDALNVFDWKCEWPDPRVLLVISPLAVWSTSKKNFTTCPAGKLTIMISNNAGLDERDGLAFGQRMEKDPKTRKWTLDKACNASESGLWQSYAGSTIPKGCTCKPMNHCGIPTTNPALETLETRTSGLQLSFEAEPSTNGDSCQGDDTAQQQCFCEAKVFDLASKSWDGRTLSSQWTSLVSLNG